MIKNFSAFKIIYTLIFVFLCAFAGDNDDLSVQGTELVDGVITNLESAIAGIDSLDKTEVRALIKQAGAKWRTFVDHHDVIFEDEFTPSDEIQGFISNISEKIDSLLHVSDENIETDGATVLREAIEKLSELYEKCDVPLLIDFTGAVCKSCKVMKTRLETVANEVAGAARVVIIDVNKKKNLRKKFKVMLIPTLVFLTSEGEEAARHVGEMEVQAITAKIAELSE